MQLAKPRIFSLFGIAINNDSMAEAVTKITSSSRIDRANTVCFVNVNTFNLATQFQQLPNVVNQADLVFPDGSGVRIAAKRMGIELRDNVNGTDLLPHLCRNAIQARKRLFLLGAEDGVAEKTARNLQQTFPGLEIAGVHHGYFDKNDSGEVIAKVNDAKTDILLVAFGSPIQEAWLQEHRQVLKVDAALAVGGLFDFFSGRIPRAPMLMRRYGLEWVWRLIQEPRAKFHRYVIGNPKFLWRCFRQLNKA